LLTASFSCSRLRSLMLELGLGPCLLRNITLVPDRSL